MVEYSAVMMVELMVVPLVVKTVETKVVWTVWKMVGRMVES